MYIQINRNKLKLMYSIVWDGKLILINKNTSYLNESKENHVFVTKKNTS